MPDVDLLDDEAHAAGTPHEEFARLREDEPVQRIEQRGRAVWSFTRHADIEAISKDPEHFSSWEAGIFPNSEQVTPLELNRNLLIYKDPPEHTKYRKILQTAFVPKTVAAMEDEIREIVTARIDSFAERGEADLVTELAVPVPLTVLARMMGVPDSDVPQMESWTHDIEMAQLAEGDATAMPVFGEMAAYLHGQIERQINERGESLVTKLRAAEVNGERLTDDEILVFFGLLVFAGNDTTRNTMANGTLALIEHPEQMERLRDDESLIPQAVEEILRYTSVVKYFCRTAKADVEVGGQRIAAGDKVLMWYSSGSRDESVCPHAQELDTTRTDQRHMAFGGGGRHFCLGAGLARLELRIVFEEIAKRLNGLELAGEPERLVSAWANSLTSLPVRFEPEARSDT